MMRVCRSWILIAALGGLGMSARPAAACTSDNECKGDRVCSAGSCVAPAPAACTADNQCTGDLVCNAGRCSAASSAAPAPTPAVSAPALGAPITSTPGAQVSFAPATNASYQVTVDTPNGLRQCLAPCSLTLEPGSRRVQISGDARFSQVVDVPAGGGAFTVQQVAPSRKTLWWTMFLGGGALTALGYYYGFVATEKNVALGVIGLAGGGPICIAGFMGVFTPMGRPQGKNAIQLRTADVPSRRSRMKLEHLGLGPVEGGVAGNAAFSF